MVDRLKASEFGGKVQKNTIMPPRTPAGTPGHTNLPAHEKLRLDYLTGQHEDTTRDPDSGEAWTGILPEKEARELMPKPDLYRDQMSDD